MANEHTGHRDRVRKRFLENGFDGFEPHEVLEMCLFYAVPRKDTNALAHRLLDRYLTIAGVCEAPVDELMREFSLSQSCAVFLKMLPEFSRVYKESKMENPNVIELEQLGEMFIDKFIGRTSEAVALMLGDAKGKMIFFDIIAKGSLNSSDVPLRKIVDLALRHNAKTAFLGHNHPSGSALPSASDIQSTRVIRQTLKNVGVTLVDHFIVTEFDYVSLRDSEMSGSIFLL